MDKSYSIFCIASQLLNGREDELDLVWEEAIELYCEFIDSVFNAQNKSELDCINDFLNTKIN